MSTTKVKSTKAPRTFINAKPNGTRGAILIDVRNIVSRSSGITNYLLCFDDGAEVVMPGTWNIRAQDFPNGIYEGQKLAAYWEMDEEGVNRFNLYEVD